MAKESRAHSAMGAKKSKSSKKKSGRKVREMRIRRAKSGGYVIHHDLEPQPQTAQNTLMNPDSNQEEHIAPDMASLQQHVADHMPEEPDGDEESAPQGGGGAE